TTGLHLPSSPGKVAAASARRFSAVLAVHHAERFGRQLQPRRDMGGSRHGVRSMREFRIGMSGISDLAPARVSGASSLALWMLAAGAAHAQPPPDLLDLSIEELGELEVTSVSR